MASVRVSVPAEGDAAAVRVFTDTEARIIALAREDGSVQRGQVEALGGLSSDQAYRLLRHLVDVGILELVGTGRSAYYRLVSLEDTENARLRSDALLCDHRLE